MRYCGVDSWTSTSNCAPDSSARGLLPMVTESRESRGDVGVGWKGDYQPMCHENASFGGHVGRLAREANGRPAQPPPWTTSDWRDSTVDQCCVPRLPRVSFSLHLFCHTCFSANCASGGLRHPLVDATHVRSGGCCGGYSHVLSLVGEAGGSAGKGDARARQSSRLVLERLRRSVALIVCCRFARTRIETGGSSCAPFNPEFRQPLLV